MPSPTLQRLPEQLGTLDRLWYRGASSHPATPIVVFAPLALLAGGWAVHRGAVLAMLGWAIAGFVGWTLLEYLIHRDFLHIGSGPLARRLNYHVHGLHHHFPTDPYLVVFPLWVTIPISSLIFFAAWLAIESPGHLALWAGVTASYINSDWTHWAVHHRRPWTALGRSQRVRHLSHHFADRRRGYGIAFGWWDWVFATRARPLPAPLDELLARPQGSYDYQDELAADGFPVLVAGSQQVPRDQ